MFLLLTPVALFTVLIARQSYIYMSEVCTHQGVRHTPKIKGNGSHQLPTDEESKIIELINQNLMRHKHG